VVFEKRPAACGTVGKQTNNKLKVWLRQGSKVETTRSGPGSLAKKKDDRVICSACLEGSVSGSIVLEGVTLGGLKKMHVACLGLVPN
jgi:hypothetical protein